MVCHTKGSCSTKLGLVPVCHGLGGLHSTRVINLQISIPVASGDGGVKVESVRAGELVPLGKELYLRGKWCEDSPCRPEDSCSRRCSQWGCG